MSDYLKTVEPASSSLTSLSRKIEADLDEVAGGIGWWNGQVGWQTSAQLGEYLLSSCTGAADSLRRASIAVKKHGQTEYSLNHARASRAQQLFGRLSTRDEKVAALSATSDSEREREELLSLWSDQVLVSLAQVLDRLAAAVLIVSGVRENVVVTDWGKLMGLAEREPRSGRSQGLNQGVFADPGSPGRAAQHRLLSVAAAWSDHGPRDWLDWLLKSRNTAVHRAPRWNLNVMIMNKNRIAGTIKPLSAQPDWVDTEAIVAASKGGLEAMFLKQSAQSIFDGLLASVTSLVESVADEASLLWTARRSNPELIVQNGASWRPKSKAAVLDFPGYGEAARIVANDTALGTSLVRRLRAAKLMDDQVTDWSDGDSGS